jgi:23S rRNA (uracil1939-C5)-methyltransferase
VTAIELTTTAMAAGGDAIGRDDDGRVVFVDGALPGERVRVDVLDERRSFARAVVLDVLEAAPARVTPPCPFVEHGCGGCAWQHIALDEQRRLKAGIVADALRRVGQVAPVAVDFGPDLPATAFRTTVRVAVRDGEVGFRHRRSHDVVGVDGCLVAHPLVDEVLRAGRFDGAVEATVRAGVATGERLVVVHPTAARVAMPEGTRVVGTDELRAGRRAWFHDEVAGRSWRISARSFFQSRADGAAALVDVVRAAAGDAVGGALVDLYGGVGLLAGGIGARGATLVERSAASAHDARHNLADLDVTVVHVAVERWRPSRADLVIADPARGGLGAKAVAKIAATRASRVVLVSCDPAAAARDAGLLADRGYELSSVTLVDLFPHTAHIEAVSRFDRNPSRRRDRG